MSLDEEDDLVGSEPDDVPTIDPDSKCRAIRTRRDDDGVNRFAGYCRNRAGKGTDHLGEGRCKYHGGCSPGAPSGHQRPATHCLDSDPHHYYRSLDDDEQAFVRRVALAMEDRLRARDKDLDYLDRVMARRIAIEFHIVSRATKYVEEEGLVQSVGGNDRNQTLLAEVRRRDRAIFDMLRDLGVLDDPQQVSVIE